MIALTLLLLFISGCQRHIKPREDSEICSVEIERVSPALHEYRCPTADSTYSSYHSPEVENAETSSKKVQEERASKQVEWEAFQNRARDPGDFGRKSLSKAEIKEKRKMYLRGDSDEW